MEEAIKQVDYEKLTPQRKFLFDEVMKNLDEGAGIWKAGWSMPKVPESAITKKQYHGINNVTLSLVSMSRGYGDYRWVTFNQMQEKGWTFKTDEEGNSLGKGAGVSIEYFDLIDKQTGKRLDRSVLDGMTIEEKNDYFTHNVKPIRKFYRVFNGDVINGIPALEKTEINPMEKVDRVEQLLDYWNENEAKIVYGGSQAYYRPKTDEIHLPNREKFFSMQEFYSTALHELGHSTGHESRLNRNIENLFGTPDYALEELRAEIASMFIEQDLEIQVDAEHKRNNSAYIAAWKKEIKDNPNALFTAITDADKIAKYVSLKVQQKKNQEQAEQKKSIEKYAIVTDKNHYDETVYKVYMAGAYGQTTLAINYAFSSKEALMEEFDKLQTLPFWADKEFQECTFEELQDFSIERAEKEQIQEEKSEVFVKPSEIAARAMPATAGKPVDMTERGIESLTRMGDRDVVERASKTRDGAKFTQLYQGISVLETEEKNERSLMSRLAMFCNGDKEQLLRVFKSSGQFRDEKPNSFYERMAEQSLKFVESIKSKHASPLRPTWGKGKGGVNAKT